MTDTGISHAIVLYLGYGSRPSPHPDPDALSALAAPDTAHLARRAEDLIADLHNAYPYTWNEQLELSEIATLLTSELAHRYPDLASEAINALVWMWTFEAWH
ncbi:MAG TPA: hypothetical protein VFU74_11855 [Actinocrinis sp.]|nr:hypothetical protein [Actinocrinis sp.]